jgi:hypothetical protein
MNFHLTAESSNKKTGKIPTTTSSRETCPTTCPFFERGCYAKGGPQNIHWKKVSEGNRGVNFDEFVQQIQNISHNSLWRHNVSGDLPHVNGNIDRIKLRRVTVANKGKKGYTYSHHVLNAHNVAAIREANAQGFTVNASTESVEVADKVMTEHGIPAVAVVPSTESRRFFKTSSGRKVIVCPATIHDSVTCKTCGLCQHAEREYIIAFPAHGSAKKTVNQIVSELN